jgi:hypothetical protein
VAKAFRVPIDTDPRALNSSRAQEETLVGVALCRRILRLVNQVPPDGHERLGIVVRPIQEGRIVM